MRIFVPREIAEAETRVALVPESASRLVKSGFEVVVEAGAGERATFSDAAYGDAGARIVAEAKAAYAEAETVLKVREPLPHPTAGAHEAELLREGSTLVALLAPARATPVMETLARRRITAFSLDSVPRISRAQKMDALSSMSTVAGYKAALLGADSLGKFFPLLMTAAGTIPPARVFVLGAGVAGLQAIATARRLGAVVEAFDIRPAVREEVQSLGATFVGASLEAAEVVAEGGYARELSAQRQEDVRRLVRERLKQADVVITSAMVPGKRAPLLITEEMLAEMRPGTVIVDMASDLGGNCALSQPGKVVVHGGVTIHGPIGLASALPFHASQMYSRNIVALLQHLTRDGQYHLDFDDEITRGTCLLFEGKPGDGTLGAKGPGVAAPNEGST